MPAVVKTARKPMTLQDVADRLDRISEEADFLEDDLDACRREADDEDEIPSGEAVASAIRTLKLDMEIAIRHAREDADAQ